MDPIIDKVLGLRCASYGYQYSEIFEYLLGGEDDIPPPRNLVSPVAKKASLPTPPYWSQQNKPRSSFYLVFLFIRK
jgi:hypothetical protein